MILSLITFAGGIGLGAFATVLLLALTNANHDDSILTPEDFERMRAEWDEINDQYDVYSSMTVDELFGDLNDEEDG